VVICGRTAGSLRETAGLATGGGIASVVADVTDPADRDLLVRRLRRDGALDVLVNNAGALAVGRISELGDDAMRTIAATNLEAPAALIRDCLPLLRAGRSPRVVNIGSMFGDIAFPLFAFYSASKFALRGLSDALRRELAPLGIAVTYAAPRAARTPASARFAALVAPFRMRLDEPAAIAAHVWDGVERGRRTIYPPSGERLLVLAQALLPRPVDRRLVGLLARATGRAPAAPRRSSRSTAA
jgi:short-subunit dehydrogenase